MIDKKLPPVHNLGYVRLNREISNLPSLTHLGYVRLNSDITTLIVSNVFYFKFVVKQTSERYGSVRSVNRLRVKLVMFRPFISLFCK